jgi:hypothetical protein
MLPVLLLSAMKGAPDTKRVRVKSCYEMFICGWAVQNGTCLGIAIGAR